MLIIHVGEMIRISRLTDYGIALLAHFASEPDRPVRTARDLAERSGMPSPTVSKLLKTLQKASLLVSQRGVNGGYRLARPPEEISVAEIILAIEGPIAMTECGRGGCDRERICLTRGNWPQIDRVVRGTLEELKLSDMARPPAGGSSDPAGARQGGGP